MPGINDSIVQYVNLYYFSLIQIELFDDFSDFFYHLEGHFISGRLTLLRLNL